MRKDVEDALEAWRAAQDRLSSGGHNGDREALQKEVERLRDEFQQLSADHMMERIDALQDAEERRHTSTPSTPSYHEAAREEEAIAADIWDSARESDQAIPRSDA